MGFFEDAWDYLTTPNENLTNLVPGMSGIASGIAETGITDIPGFFGMDPNAGGTNLPPAPTLPTNGGSSMAFETDLWAGPTQSEVAGIPRPPKVPVMRLGGYAWKYMPGTKRYAEGYRWVKTRRMNPLNPRALSRAMTRSKSFERFVLRNFSILHRSKVKPKRHRRK